VNNTTKTYNNDELQSTNVDEKSLDGLKRFELGYAAGVGFATSSGLSIGVRYNGSFSDFVDEDVNFDGDLTNARNSTIMATVGFTFGGR